ncbi:hypothetical protein DU002_19145 [Corallincola holothuriorum]|uniref:Uncharacterized protein n=1 Tax=Corallincola holothuriorum TaxID=2282215 RepID=A0A368MXC1_9GAMM|nr:hypothetical protein [Corallincola holothuriorum]RCU42872.1 hypothetical protein DU002_19145 [Corallincola holothuriorum]
MGKDYEIIKPFLPNYIDSVLCLKAAFEAQDPSTKRLLVKSTILHCSFAVEALANNLIQFLDFSTGFGNSIDKLDPIAKLEMFSFLMKKGGFDRGQYQIQVFSSLIKIRNDYVHPKTKQKNRVFSTKPSEHPIDIYVVGEEQNNRNKGVIDISVESSQWVYEDALKCLSAFTRAIDVLLLDVLELEENSLMCTFLNKLFVDGMRGPSIPNDHVWLEWLMTNTKIEPKFYSHHIKKKINRINTRLVD